MLRRPAVLALLASLALTATAAAGPAAGLDSPHAGAPRASGDAGEAGWVRIELSERVTTAGLAALRRTGVSALTYLGDDAFAAWASAPGRAAAAAVPGVRAVRAVPAEDKIDRALSRLGAAVAASVVTAAPRAAAVRARLAAAGATAVVDYDLHGGLFAFDALLPATAVPGLASDADVLSIGPGPVGLFPDDEGTAQILSGALEGGAPVPGYETGHVARGIDGEGVVISISDTGIQGSHPEFAGRVKEEIFYGSPQAEDFGGHGTHVAGIVGGKGATLATGMRHTDLAGFLSGIGVAPKVTFVNQAIIPNGSFVGGPPNAFEEYTEDAIEAGAVGWNASWNTGGANSGYVARARSLDVATRDGAPAQAGNQPFTMVFSAGNSGPGARSITQPKEAKNIITVASTHSQRVLPASSSGVDTVSNFSSRGPARDGRLLPTVSAPGQDVLSAAAAAGRSCGGPPTSAGGVEPYATSTGLYSTCSGTSMAAPHVTGAVVLITDWWRSTSGGADPSPALAKALLVNTATDMGNADIPNGSEGWGRVNLGRLFDPAAERVYVDQTVVFTDREQARSWSVEAADPAKPVRVTLVWTDAPGAPGAFKALVNDLDLTVTAEDGTTYRGNVFAGGRSQPGGSADHLNNVENVFAPVAGGRYDVTVSSWNLPGDGIPGDEQFADQDFALVIDNARLVG